MARQDMRVVEVMVMSDEALRRVQAVLDEFNVDYATSDYTDDADPSATVRFPLPAHEVESIQEQIDSRLSDLEPGNDTYTVVTDPEAVVSSRLDVREKHGTSTHDGPERISRGELHSQATDLLPDTTIYTILTVISSVVATSGVLLDSVSVMVGSMVIAPLIGPPMATSVSTVLDDEHLFVHGAKLQAIGGTAAIITAFLFALFAKETSLVPLTDVSQTLKLSNYASPTFLLITVALGAGIAAAFSLATSGTVDLIGVMMAAALVPPIGVMGVGLAWGRLTAVLGSGAVVLVNLLSINLGAIVSLWYLGYHPRGWSEPHSTRSTILRRVLVLLLLIGGVAVVLSSLAGGHLAKVFGL